MAAERATDSFALLARQLARLLESHDMHTSFERLRDAAGSHRRADVDSLQQLLTTPESFEARAKKTPWRALAALLPEAHDSEARLVQVFVDYVERHAALYRTYWAGIAGQLSYLVVLLALVLVITGIFGFYVLPGFEQMFARSGATLPALTRAVFAATDAGYPLLAIAALLVIAAAIWFAIVFRRRVRSLSPLPGIPGRVPLAGAVAETYNTGLFLNFTKMLLDCGVSVDQALAAAAQHANRKPVLDAEALRALDKAPTGNRVLGELAIAARLGQLQPEIDSQCERHEADLAAALVAARDRFSLGTSIVVGLLVGLIVIAMYLPIFRMGAVI